MNARVGMVPRETISAAIRQAATAGRPAVVGFTTAGFPDRAGFVRNLQAIAAEADVVEIGVPFSDPMADGATIQRASLGAVSGNSSHWRFEKRNAMSSERR